MRGWSRVQDRLARTGRSRRQWHTRCPIASDRRRSGHAHRRRRSDPPPADRLRAWPFQGRRCADSRGASSGFGAPARLFFGRSRWELGTTLFMRRQCDLLATGG